MKISKLYLGCEFKRYKHGTKSIMLFALLPWIFFQRDPKGEPEAHRPYPPLMVFVGWLFWQFRVDLRL